MVNSASCCEIGIKETCNHGNDHSITIICATYGGVQVISYNSKISNFNYKVVTPKSIYLH